MPPDKHPYFVFAIDEFANVFVQILTARLGRRTEHTENIPLGKE